MLTPNEINVLLHYHVCPEQHPRANSPAVVDATQKFLIDGIFDSTGSGRITTTDKGKAFVQMLCETPYPKLVWVDPRNITEDIK